MVVSASALGSPVYYYIISPSPSQMVTSTPTFPLLPVVFVRLTTDFYELPTLLHIQTNYIVYNVVRGVIEFKVKAEICKMPY